MKPRWVLIISVLLGAVIVNSVSAQTYVWKKYDDFNSGVINLNKWAIDSSSASISIENGRAKFEHQLGHPNDSAWLAVKKDLSNVIGIRATVTFDSCNFGGQNLKDVRARVGTFIGMDRQNHDHFLFSELVILPYYNNVDDPTLYASISQLDAPNNFALIEELFGGEFLHVNGAVPEDLMGTPYVFTMEWNLSVPQSVTYTVNGLGKMKYTWETTLKIRRITDPTKTLLGIGTRSTSGGGICTAYFDDVYLKYAL